MKCDSPDCNKTDTCLPSAPKCCCHGRAAEPPTPHTAPGGSRLEIANTRRSSAHLPPACESGHKQLQRSGGNSAMHKAATPAPESGHLRTREGVWTGVDQKYLKWALKETSLLAAEPDPKSARLLLITSHDKIAPPPYNLASRSVQIQTLKP